MSGPVYLSSYRIEAELTSDVWTNLITYVMADIECGPWGMEGNKPTDLVARTGELKFVLDNTLDLQFLPDQAGALAGWGRGTGIRLVCVFENEPFVRFRGKVAKIAPGRGLFGHRRISVTALDWMDDAAREPIENPGILTNQRGDAVIRTVLSMMPIQPAATDLDTGVSVFGTTFDTVTSKTRALSEFGKVAFSEAGRVYLRKDRLYGETLVFENAQHRNGLRPLSTISVPKDESGYLLKADGGGLLKADGGRLLLNKADELTLNETTMDEETAYGDGIINRFVMTAVPRRLDSTPQVLFKLDEIIYLTPGQEIDLEGTYADPAGGQPINGQNMQTPTTPTDFLFNAQQDGLGTNLSANLSVTPGYGTEGFKHRVKNTGTSGGYIVRFWCRGYGIYQYNPISTSEKDRDSIDEYGTSSETMEQKYQRDLWQGALYARQVIEEEKYPRTTLNSVHFNANTSGRLMQAFLRGDVGFLFRVIVATKNIDTLCYVQAAQFVIKPGGFIMCHWIVKEAVNLSLGLTMLAVQFAPSTTDAINYGYLPQVYSDSTPTTMTISAWIKTPDGGPIAGFTTNAGGLRFALYRPGGVPKLYAYSNVHNVAPGEWWSDALTINSTTWYHVAMTFDIASPANDPKLYLNGVARTITETGTPSGTAFSKTGVPLIIGNRKSATENYDFSLNGTLKDVRIYHRILSDSEILALYNSGTPDYAAGTTGMVFQAFAVRTKRLSSYVDQSLTDSLKLLDTLYGMVGSPVGAPVARLP